MESIDRRAVTEGDGVQVGDDEEINRKDELEKLNQNNLNVLSEILENQY